LELGVKQMVYDNIVRVGADLAQCVVQVHAVDAAGKVIAAKQLQRTAFLPWCDRLPKGCVVAFEACSAAHYLARRLEAIGLVPRLIPPSFVAPYRLTGVTGKNDATDAEAICEAACRPRMRFVSVKTPEQQGWLAIHRLRDGYIKDRTACLNRARAILFEFGVTLPLSGARFREALVGAVSSRESVVPATARPALRRCCAYIEQIDRQVTWCDQQIAKHARSDENARLAMAVRGVGPLGASALAATLGDLAQFDNGRQFGAWLGLVPRQHSSGGKQRLGRITKRGDAYLRKLLVIGARSAIAVADRHDDVVSTWAVQLKNRIGWPKACVALANRNARTLWRTLARKDPATTTACKRSI
jgi:transposase